LKPAPQCFTIFIFKMKYIIKSGLCLKFLNYAIQVANLNLQELTCKNFLYALCFMLYALCFMLYALCFMLHALCFMLYEVPSSDFLMICYRKPMRLVHNLLD
jgi:hypothetical protein